MTHPSILSKGLIIACAANSRRREDYVFRSSVRPSVHCLSVR